MDKAILKKFAVESRQDLMQKMENKIKSFYIDEEFSKQQSGEIYILSNNEHNLNLSKDEYIKRDLLIKKINELGLDQVIEEAAYTWFNRIVAIRYMEIHDFLPLTRDNQSIGIRVLSSKDNTPDPEIMKFTNLINPDLDINFKKEKYVELKDADEKFKYILLLICQKLGKVIPQIFGSMTDYVDILIPDNLLNESGYVSKIINEVPEENYNKVEIIGWLYQYYNQAEKDKAMAGRSAYNKKEIPYVTQLFTPEWIVRYLVENTLGRLYIQKTGDYELAKEWKYFLENDLNIENKYIDIQNITLIDPCCGSGHILVYAFELFYTIYKKLGYEIKSIPSLIIKNNLYGIDIDDRASQLTVLSLLLKAREYDKYLFSNIKKEDIHIYAIKESNNINSYLVDNIYYENLKNDLINLLSNFKDAKTIGSLLKIKDYDYNNLEKFIKEDDSILGIEMRNNIMPLITISKILNKKYDIYVTNPPYLNADRMNPVLKKYVKKYYYNYKQDLYAAFMGLDILKKDGYFGMINQHGWMFLSTFENTRIDFLNKYTISSLLHLGPRTFEEIGGEVVQNSCFVAREGKHEITGNYIRLVDYKNHKLKEDKYLEAIKTQKNLFKFTGEFNSIPGCPISYWVDKNILNVFNNCTLLGDLIPVKKGMDTGNNNRFIRYWYEVDFNKTVMKNNDKTSKWICYNKGGTYKKWYGNNYYVVNWEHNGRELKYSTANIRSENLYFKPSITWTALGNCTFRLSYPLSIFDSSGSSMFPDKKNMYDILAFCNSNVMNVFLDILNPTLSSGAGTIFNLPILKQALGNEEIKKISMQNVELVKKDWDSNELSWGFTKNCLIQKGLLNNILDNYKLEVLEQRNILQKNEEKINEFFTNIYGLKDSNIIKVDEKKLSIKNKENLELIKQLISYSVGCMFGRYSLDEDGLIYTGGEFYENQYHTFKVDNDNIIPITENIYFDDDIVQKFRKFIEVVYGKENLNENLNFIAETLGKKGTETSEETIRRYFINDFFNDHVKMYQKRPIYWLLDSGKKNGFKALIYMHRYTDNLIPKARLDYLHKIQTIYEKLLVDINYKLTTDLSMIDKKETQKIQSDLNAKLQEIKEYDEKIAHLANQRIKIDLDDGVKTNYEKFKDILAKIK